MVSMDSPLAIIVSSGILARCEEQHRPLMLERYADRVVYRDYTAGDFDGDRESSETADDIAFLRRDGYRVINLGSSLGGNVASFAADMVWRSDRTAHQWLDNIVVDAPFGVRSLKQVPFPAGVVTSPVGTAALAAFAPVIMGIGRTKMGLPKDDEISQPSDRVIEHLGVDPTVDEPTWKQEVKLMAKSGLTGHSATDWRRQIQWMCDIGADGSLAAALSGVRGLRFTYVQCTKGNPVVAQPMAQQAHVDLVGQNTGPDELPTLLTVEAPHCAYLQQQKLFEPVIGLRLHQTP